jgi:hypothetical protein
MNYSDTYTQTPAEMLAAEFVVTYTKSGSWVHAKECTRYRTKIRSEAHVGALRHGAVLAVCCRDHELRYLNLGKRVGAW